MLSASMFAMGNCDLEWELVSAAWNLAICLRMLRYLVAGGCTDSCFYSCQTDYSVLSFTLCISSSALFPLPPFLFLLPLPLYCDLLSS